MAEIDKEKTRELLLLIKADLQKTLDIYRKATVDRAKKIEQDLEQINVYFEILESGEKSRTLNARIIKKINRLISWTDKAKTKSTTLKKQQDRFEDHFREIQKTLVILLSNKFKY